LIFTSAEALDKGTKKILNLVSQNGLFDYYACSEFSLLAWECTNHQGYHINADSVAMEFIRQDEAVDYGESGEVTCTSLSNTSMPLIRYKIGDGAVPSDEQCSCGVTLPLMKIMEGKIDDFLVATNGTKIPPTIFFPFPFDSFNDIKRFRVIQETKNKLRFQMVVTEDFSKERTLEKATDRLKKVFGAGMDIEFEFMPDLDKGGSRKLRKVLSLIPKEETT
jgi:phenylacetate-CoA ligase